MIKKLTVLMLAGAAALSLCACNEYKEAQDSFYGEMDGLVSEANELKDKFNENVYGTDNYRQDSYTVASGISSMTNAQNASNANVACKQFYSDIVSGSATDEMTNTGGMNLSRALPSVGDSAEARKQAAQQFTVGDALSYKGDNITLENLFYAAEAFDGHTRGDILAGSDPSAEGNSSKLKKLVAQTTLGELYGS